MRLRTHLSYRMKGKENVVQEQGGVSQDAAHFVWDLLDGMVDCSTESGLVRLLGNADADLQNTRWCGRSICMTRLAAREEHEQQLDAIKAQIL